MSADIVARLRGHIAITTRIHYAKDGFPEPVYVHGPSPICQEAADEIERLRLELSIPRDEYAMTWKALLDRIEDLDLVDWIRAYANAYSPSDYNSPIAREVIVRSDKKWMEAADEIERLRAELVSTTNKLTAERDELQKWKDAHNTFWHDRAERRDAIVHSLDECDQSRSTTQAGEHDE